MTKHLSTGNLIKISLISALLTQISHAAFVFERISHEDNEMLKQFLSYVFAISLELSIYIFTMKGKRNSAIAFGIISALVNVFYYWYSVDTSLNFLSSIVVSLIVPTIIYVYSEVIEDEQKKKVGRPVGSISKIPKPNNMPQVKKFPKIPKRNVEKAGNGLKKFDENTHTLPIISEEIRPSKEKIILKPSIKKNIKKSKTDDTK